MPLPGVTTAGHVPVLLELIDFATGANLVTIGVYGEPTAAAAQELAERIAGALNTRLTPPQRS